jgi:glycosyltransferase involved in cell wall biosynthesis
MNILFLSPVVPHPQTDGGRQRIHSILDALVGAHAVTFVGVGRPEDLAAWSLSSRMSPDSFAMPSDEHGASRDRLTLPWWARPSAVSRLERSGLWARLAALPLASFDAVHAETMITAPFAAEVHTRHPRASLVIDLPDIASHYRARALVSSRRGLLRPRAVREAVQIAQLYGLEHALFGAAAAIFVCSAIDRDRIVHRVSPERVLVVPNCTHIGAPLPPAPPDGRMLVFVGTMSYQPNDEGVRWFCEAVWPRVRGAVADARFVVVGKSPSPEVQALGRTVPGVTVTGEVEEVRPYLTEAVATVVPLLTGGGTRLKILESMAASRAVVSTRIGAEGIDATDGEHLVLADEPAALSSACVRMLLESSWRDRIASGGRARAEAAYDWRAAQRMVLDRYERLTA